MLSTVPSCKIGCHLAAPLGTPAPPHCQPHDAEQPDRPCVASLQRPESPGRRPGAMRRALSRRVWSALPTHEAARGAFGGLLGAECVAGAAAPASRGVAAHTALARRGVASSSGGGGSWHRHQGEPGWYEMGYSSELSHHAADGGAHLYSLHASEWQQQHYLLSAAARRAAAEAKVEAGVGDRYAPIEVSWMVMESQWLVKVSCAAPRAQACSSPGLPQPSPLEAQPATPPAPATLPHSPWRLATRTRPPAAPPGSGPPHCQRTRRMRLWRPTAPSVARCRSPIFMRCGRAVAEPRCVAARTPGFSSACGQDIRRHGVLVVTSCSNRHPLPAGCGRLQHRQPAGAAQFLGRCGAFRWGLSAQTPSQPHNHPSTPSHLSTSPHGLPARCCAPRGCAAAPPAWQTCVSGSSERALHRLQPAVFMYCYATPACAGMEVPDVASVLGPPPPQVLGREACSTQPHSMPVACPAGSAYASWPSWRGRAGS